MDQSQAIGADAEALPFLTAGSVPAVRASGPGRISPARLLWSRALPGTVVVFAALALPEFSVGAGDFPAARPRLAAGSAPALTLPVTAPPASSAAAPPAADRSGGDEPAAGLAPQTDFAAVRTDPALSVAPGGDAGLAAAFAAPAEPADVAAPAAAASLALPAAAVIGDAEGAAVGAAPRPALPLAEAGTPQLGFITGPVAVAGLPSEPVEIGTLELPRDSADGTAQALVPVSPVPALAAQAMSSTSPPVLLPVDDRASAARPVGASPQAVAAPAPSAPAGRRPPLAPTAEGFADALVSSGAAGPSPGASAAAVPIAAPLAVAAAAPTPPVSGSLSRRASAPAAEPLTAPSRAERAAPPALAGIPRAPARASAPGLAAQAGAALDIRSQLLTRIDGKAAGKLDFQQTATGLKVRIGSLADVLGDRFDPATLARLRSSSASNVYLPLSQLQAQGIPISYDPVYDEFNIGVLDTRPKAAAKVHMQQITAPERGIGSVDIGQIPRFR